MKDLADIPCAPGLKIASFNISNMHTNIPIKDLLDIIDVMCKHHNLESTLIQVILKITRLITTQNYFKFRDKTYLQKNGLAMGAPTFPFYRRFTCSTLKTQRYMTFYPAQKYKVTSGMSMIYS